MNAELAKSLRLWKMKTIYNRPGDWVYASPAKKGTQPYWPKSIYRVYIKRAADKIGLREIGVRPAILRFSITNEFDESDARFVARNTRQLLRIAGLTPSAPHFTLPPLASNDLLGRPSVKIIELVRRIWVEFMRPFEQRATPAVHVTSSNVVNKINRTFGIVAALADVTAPQKLVESGTQRH